MLNFITNHFIYWSYRVKYLLKSESIEYKGVVWIDFKSNIFRRRIASITYWFAKAGYKVVLYDTFRFIGSMSGYDKLVFSIPECKLAIIKPSVITLTLTNKQKKRYRLNEVFVNNNYWIQEKNNTWHIPLGLHPHFYYKDIIPDLESLRKRDNRRICIFFSGNLQEELYDLSVINDNFRILSRHEIIKTLKTEINSKQLLIPNNINELTGNNLSKCLVLNDISKVWIPQEKFIEFLSNCSFFLFTPGVVFPLCHNNFEAMAAGCIPITQYANYHFPNLINKENCLVFKDEYDLVNVIKEALSMDDNKINQMRKKVIEYYDNFLCEDAIINNIETKVFKENIKELVLL